MSGLFDLTGKVALVTGGGRGIGLMAARGLREAGAMVHIVSRKLQACQQAAAELGDGVIPWGADLSTEAACREFADELIEQTGGLDILVNNAGATWGAPIEQFETAAWDKVLDLNLKSPFFLVRELLPALEPRGSVDDPSRIINIGSIDGLRVPTMSTYSYSASKAALHHLTRVLAVELGPRHVTVNAIAPGPFQTKMMATVLDESPGEFEQIAPLGRLGRADDIAGLVVMLAARSGAYLTGTVIPVDGGISIVSPR